MVMLLAGGGTVHKLCLCRCSHACVTVVIYSLLSRKDHDANSTNDIIIFVSVLLHALCGPL